MPRKPDIFKIIQSDSWTATALGAFTFLLAITTFSLLTDQILMNNGLNSTPLVVATGVCFLVSIIVMCVRVNQIKEIFENGSELIATIVSCKVHKANMKLTLRYHYLGQVYEKNYDQVITMKTKHFIRENEAALVVDRQHPERFVLRDVYL
ncbi:MAG: hypothetical protein IPO22_20700 [Anaerolineales bacterium]|nr:hypothetical protein [Anaerolineales bacterium]